MKEGVVVVESPPWKLLIRHFTFARRRLDLLKNLLRPCVVIVYGYMSYSWRVC